MGAEQAVQRSANDFQHFGIAHAPLAGASGMPFSSIVSIILGVLSPVARGRQQAVTGMHPQIVDKKVGRLFQAHPGTKKRVFPQEIVAALPVTEGGNLRPWTHRDGVDTGKIILSSSPVIHPHFLLQEVAGRVRKALALSFQHHGAFFHQHAERIFRQVGHFPQQDIGLFRASFHYGERIPGSFSQIALQDGGGGCVFRSNNAAVVVEPDVLGPGAKT